MNKKVVGIIVAVVVIFGVSYFVSQQNNRNDSTGKPTADTSTGTTLDLSGQQLTSIPESVLSRTDLTILNLSNNQLTTLPASISRLTNLVELNVENNRLGSLPAELSDMTWLKHLDISNNRLPGNQINHIKSKLTNTEVKT